MTEPLTRQDVEREVEANGFRSASAAAVSRALLASARCELCNGEGWGSCYKCMGTGYNQSILARGLYALGSELNPRPVAPEGET